MISYCYVENLGSVNDVHLYKEREARNVITNLVANDQARKRNDGEIRS